MAWSKVDFLESGDSYYSSSLAAVISARHTVLVEMYIFRADRVGLELLDALAAAKKRGARVYLRVDGVGSLDHLEELSAFCLSKSLDFEIYHPPPFAFVRDFHPRGEARVDNFLIRLKMVNRRTHRKLILVDNTIAFSGGRNIDEVESERYNLSSAWHDLSLRLEGESVPLLEESFWLRRFHRQPSSDFLLNHTWKLRRSRNAWFSSKFQTARQNIWIITPYFAPLPMLLFKLRKAAKRGVDIRLVLPKKTDVPISRMAARALYYRLLLWGVRIFEYEPSVLHRKLWLIDETAAAGSGNLNHRSFIHDLELDILLTNPMDVTRAREIFLKDQNFSREIRLEELEQLPFWKRIGFWLASWLVYWL